MKKIIDEYHRQAIERKKNKSVVEWQAHPLPLKECLEQFKRLREQRLTKEHVRISKFCL